MAPPHARALTHATVQRERAASALTRLVRRSLQAALVVWGASTIAFVLVRLAPGDPWAARFADNTNVTAAIRAEWAAAAGLNDPLPVQYVRWLGATVRGDLGFSTSRQRPVAQVLREVLPRTLVLMSTALAAALLLGVLVGRWQGTRTGTLGDELTSTGTLLVYALPDYLVALLVLQAVVLWFGIAPGASRSASVGAGGLSAALTNWTAARAALLHFVWPWATLTLVGAAVFARYQRAAMASAWRQPFVQAARARGLPEVRVRMHAWRTALPAVITTAGLALPALVGGAVFVERIFGWPGMGAAVVDAVASRDYDLVLAIVVLGSAFTVAGSVLADLVLERADPRARAVG